MSERTEVCMHGPHQGRTLRLGLRRPKITSARHRTTDVVLDSVEVEPAIASLRLASGSSAVLGPGHAPCFPFQLRKSFPG